MSNIFYQYEKVHEQAGNFRDEEQEIVINLLSAVRCAMSSILILEVDDGRSHRLS